MLQREIKSREYPDVLSMSHAHTGLIVPRFTRCSVNPFTPFIARLPLSLPFRDLWQVGHAVLARIQEHEFTRSRDYWNGPTNSSHQPTPTWLRMAAVKRWRRLWKLAIAAIVAVPASALVTGRRSAPHSLVGPWQHR